MKPRKELEKVLERVNQQFRFEEAHLELLSDRRREAFLQFVQNDFLPDEVLCRSIGLGYDKYCEEFVLELYKNDLTLLLVSDSTDEIVAIKACRLIYKTVDSPQIKNDKLRTIFTFLAQKDKELDVFDKYGVDVAVEFVMLGVSRRYRHKHFGAKITEAAMSYFSGIGLASTVCKVEATSNYSKAIYEHLSFDALHELNYDDYQVDGKIVFRNTGIHKSTIVYGIWI